MTTTNKALERSAEKLAQFFHDTYEHHAKREGWKTQDICHVEFDQLPEANRRTMVATCADVLDALNTRAQAADVALAKKEEQLRWKPISELQHYVETTGRHAFIGCCKSDFWTEENDAHIIGTAYELDGQYYLMNWRGDDVVFQPTHWMEIPNAPTNKE